MVIDIVLVIAALIALIAGWRRGFIVQLFQLVGLYFAFLLAPEFASLVGSRFIANPAIAYIAGFAIIIFATWLVVWIIAPLLRKILFWEPLKRLDSLLGMALAIVACFIINTVCCSLLSTANIGEPRADKLIELGSQGLSDEEIEVYVERLNSKDRSLRDCFESKYIAFHILDDSILFYPMAEMGDAICPQLEAIKGEMARWAISIASNYEPRY